MLNKKFPNSSRYVSWALKQAPELMSVKEYENRQYQEYTKFWDGGSCESLASIRAEIGRGRVYLVKTESHQVWIESGEKLRICEVRSVPANCCRCSNPLDDRDSALFGACEDCISGAGVDPESFLQEFARGEWG